MDGMHRILKVALERRDTIPAKRFERDPEPDYIGVELDELPYRAAQLAYMLQAFDCPRLPGRLRTADHRLDMLGSDRLDKVSPPQ